MKVTTTMMGHFTHEEYDLAIYNLAFEENTEWNKLHWKVDTKTTTKCVFFAILHASLARTSFTAN